MDMMLLVFSFIAACPFVGLSCWLIDETYGERIAPRTLVERARAFAQRHKA